MSMNNARKSTSTRSFGSSGWSSHDSSSFYNRKLFDNVLIKPNEDQSVTLLPPLLHNVIICKSSISMSEIPNNSIHLIVTSPPYNVGKTYDLDLTLNEYLDLLTNVFSECYRVLIPGGRICLNIADLGRKPTIPLHSLCTIQLVSMGFFLRGEIIWNKGVSAGMSTAWGSWKSPSNPTLHDVHEYILVFSKNKFSRHKEENKEPTISKDEFLTYHNSIWSFPTVSAKRMGHPAPFPVELPYRCIQFYTYSNDIVLDPFMGSGSTAVAAKKTGRIYVGYEINLEYCELANNRINQIDNNILIG